MYLGASSGLCYDSISTELAVLPGFASPGISSVIFRFQAEEEQANFCRLSSSNPHLMDYRGPAESWGSSL